MNKWRKECMNKWVYNLTNWVKCWKEKEIGNVYTYSLVNMNALNKFDSGELTMNERMNKWVHNLKKGVKYWKEKEESGNVLILLWTTLAMVNFNSWSSIMYEWMNVKSYEWREVWEAIEKKGNVSILLWNTSTLAEGGNEWVLVYSSSVYEFTQGRLFFLLSEFQRVRK